MAMPGAASPTPAPSSAAGEATGVHGSPTAASYAVTCSRAAALRVVAAAGSSAGQASVSSPSAESLRQIVLRIGMCSAARILP